MDNEALGKLVKDHRDARGWSQARLAQEAGIAEGTVTSMEKGQNTRPSKRRRVLDALGIVGPGMPHEDEFPQDVKTFLRIVGARLTALDDDSRTRALARLYPLNMEETEVQRTADRIFGRAVAAKDGPDESLPPQSAEEA